MKAGLQAGIVAPRRRPPPGVLGFWREAPPGGPPRAGRRRPRLDARQLRRDALRPRSRGADPRPRHDHGHGRAARIADARRLGGRGPALRRARRPLRPHARPHLERAHLLRVHRACGLAQSVAQLAVFRVCLGIGMGGEWASGAALVSETWPAQHRGKALGLMQSAWAIGYGLAAIVTAIVLPRWGWRAVFFVGIVPALLTLWIRRRVPEPAMWRRNARRTRRTRARGSPTSVRGLRSARLTLWSPLMNACTMFAWWGFNLWIPAYLSLPAGSGRSRAEHRRDGRPCRGDAGRDVARLRHLRLHQRRGRQEEDVRRLPASARPRSSWPTARRGDRGCCSRSDPSSRFSASGYFSGFGAVTAEIYPRRSGPPRRGSPTTSAASPAPPRRSRSARWPQRAGSAWRSPRRRSHSCSPRCAGSASPRRAGGRSNSHS